MKAIVVTDQAAGTAGMKLVERPEPQAAINDVIVSRGATCANRSNRLIPELDHNSTAKEHDVRQLR